MIYQQNKKELSLIKMSFYQISKNIRLAKELLDLQKDFKARLNLYEINL